MAPAADPIPACSGNDGPDSETVPILVSESGRDPSAIRVGVLSSIVMFLIVQLVTTQTWYDRYAFQLVFGTLLLVVSVRMALNGKNPPHDNIIELLARPLDLLHFHPRHGELLSKLFRGQARLHHLVKPIERNSHLKTGVNFPSS